MRPRPATIFAVLAVLAGLLLSPRGTPPSVQFDTSFWDLSKITAPTNATMTGWQTLQSGVLESNVTYFSETYGGSPVIIEGLLYKPNQNGKLPAVLVMHGSFGDAESMAYFAELLAAKGYVALAISGPGQGASTGPSETNQNRLNLTGGAYYSYYYRLLYSALRGITFLTELPFVDAGRIAATGASQGGLECLWLSALDHRLRTVIPIVAGGNFSFLVFSGSLALGHLPPGTRLDDPRGELLMKYFDPLAYVPESKAPVLMLVGTSDQFFPLDSYNQTYSLLGSEKSILIVPNTGHFIVKAEWIASAETWLSKWLKDEGSFPQVSLLSISRKGGRMEVNASASGVDGVVLNFRDGWPWSRWETYPMNRTGEQWSVSLPLSSVDVTIYVSGMSAGYQVVSSNTQLYKADETGLASTGLFLICVFSVALLVRVSITMDWISSLERAVVWSAIWCTTLLPLLVAGGVAPLPIWTIMRTYELWVHPAIPFVIFALLPAGTLLAAGSDRWLKAMSVVTLLVTGLSSLAALSYASSAASLSLGMTLWVQIAIAIALFAEPLIAKKPPSLDRSIAILFERKPKQ
ncbi:MAG TPA: acetylxylan esterase, partial [Thermoproteota archaeon]|nr:acetylxylan esterase [Thermoproteota archaeon]